MIEELLNDTGKFLDFPKKHRSIENAGKHLQDQLILLDSNEECKEFSALMGDVSLLFKTYCPDSNIDERYEVNANQFKEYLQKIFIKLQKFKD